jgi:hypothetical protein
VRFREGDPIVNLPHPPLNDETFVGTAVYCLALGIGGLIAGWYAKKFWLGFWSGTLVIASMAYLSYVLLFLP